MSEEGCTIPLPGVDLQVVRRGVGPALLLLHGGDGPQHRWPFFERLTARFDVIAPIHPGFDGSPIPEHFDGMEDLVYLYLDLLQALDLHQIILTGFDMGGWTAVEMAVRTTQRLAKLILVGAVGIKPGDRDSRDIADIFATPDAEVARLLMHDAAQHPYPAAMHEAQLATLVADRMAYALYTWDPYMHNPKLVYRLHRVDVPTLLLWGESDGMVPLAYAEAYGCMLPQATLVTIPEAGHLPQREQPERFIEHLVAFATP